MLRRYSKLIVFLTALMAVAGVALAFYTATGSGSGSGTIGTLNAPTSVTATSPSGSSRVDVGWTASAATASGLAPTGYRVTRTDSSNTTSYVCGTSASTALGSGATSCADQPVADGTYTYAVIAVYRSWTAKSSGNPSVSVARDNIAPTSSASVGAAQTKNSTFTISYTAGDAGGSGLASIRLYAKGPTDSDYSAVGSAISISGNAAAGSFPAYTATEADGSYRFYTRAVDQNGNTEDAPGAADATVLLDTTAPAGGSVTANGSPSASYNANGHVPLSVTSFTDGGSGIASNTLTRATASLSGDSCGALSGATPVTIAGDGTDSATLGNGCYQYTLTGVDQMNNQATTQSAVVKVDTTAPSTPTLAFSGLSNAFWTPGPSILYFRSTAPSGSFTVTASSSDPDTGIGSYNFPALTGWTPTPGALGVNTYSWTSGTPGQGPATVTAANRASALSSGVTFTLTADNAAPVPALSYPTGNTSATAYTSSGNGSWGKGNSNCGGQTNNNFAGFCGTASDSGSGVATSEIQIRDVSTSKCWSGSGWVDAATSCPFVAPTAGTATNWSLPFAFANFGLTGGTTRQYTVTARSTDQVGNTPPAASQPSTTFWVKG